jgi:hypothetical protein
MSTQKIIVVQLDYCGGKICKSYIETLYEVEARITPKCFIFKWGRDLSIEYRAKRCTRGNLIDYKWDKQDLKFERTSWHLYTFRDGRRVQAYTPEHWDKVKNLYLTSEKLSELLLAK